MPQYGEDWEYQETVTDNKYVTKEMHLSLKSFSSRTNLKFMILDL